MHEVKHDAVAASTNHLVPFSLAAKFSTSQNFSTTRHASQMFHQSPRDEIGRHGLGSKDGDPIAIQEGVSRQVMPKSISNEERYRSGF